MQLQTMRFVEARLTPSVRVERSEIERYYNDVLTPQIRTLGEQPDTLAMVAARIRQLLTEQKVNDLFFRWMADLRAQSDIVLLSDDADALAGMTETTEPPIVGAAEQQPAHDVEKSAP